MEGFMRKTLIATAVLGAVTAVSVSARADETPNLKGRFYVGIERMTGFGYTSTSVTSGAGTTATVDTQSAFSLNLLGASTSYAQVGSALGVVGTPVTLDAPRLAFDYNLLSFLTVGLGAYFSWASLRQERNGGDTTEAVHLTGFGLSPRVGATIPIGDRLIFWGRAGVTYGRLNADTPSRTLGGVTQSSSTYESLFWVNLEPTLLVKLVEHVSVGATFVVDLPVAAVLGQSTTATITGGSTTTVSSSVDLTQWNVGLQLGLTTWF
jgi:hypothetical protein